MTPNEQAVCTEWVEQINQLFTGKLSPARSGALYEHLRACPACERAYDRWAKAERALFAKASALTALERDRVKDRLFGSAPVAAAPSGRRALAFTAVLAAAAAGVLAVVLVRPNAPFPVGDRGLIARGGAKEVDQVPGVTLRVLRVRAGANGAAEVFDLGSGRERVTAGDRLKVLVTSLAHAGAVSVAARAYGGGSATMFERVLVEAGAQDRSLGGSFTVPAAWPAGRLEIRAVFTADGGGEVVRVVETTIEQGGGTPTGEAPR